MTIVIPFEHIVDLVASIPFEHIVDLVTSISTEEIEYHIVRTGLFIVTVYHAVEYVKYVIRGK